MSVKQEKSDDVVAWYRATCSRYSDALSVQLVSLSFRFIRNNHRIGGGVKSHLHPTINARVTGNMEILELPELRSLRDAE